MGRNRVIEGEVIRTTLSFNQYVDEIIDARNHIQSVILKYASQIKECLDVYPDRQIDLAEQLNISPPMLSKWKSIGNNERLLELQDQTPNTFRVLYDLTRLENEYIKFYGEKRGSTEYNKLLGSGKITVETEVKDVTKLFSDLKKKIDAKKESIKEKNILSLTDATTNTPVPKQPSLQDFIDRDKKFKTIVILPSEKQIARWRKLELSGYIAEEFPVSELRYPTPVDVGLCLIRIKMKDLKTGLKLLDACGYEYRDIFVPKQSVPMLVRMSEEEIILRGERDKGKTPDVAFSSTSTEDILSIAEAIGKKPYLLISTEGTDRDKWSGCSE